MKKKTVIVAGITRSGLTLTMQMLEAGGFPCVGEYPGFEKYPMGEIPWAEVRGMAVKVVDTHEQLPPPGDYAVIRLRRDPTEQAKSINKFMSVMGVSPVPLSKLKASTRKNYKVIDQWVRRQSRYTSLEFEQILTQPLIAAQRLQEFLGCDLDLEAMAERVVLRSPNCYPTMLEVELSKGGDL